MNLKYLIFTSALALLPHSASADVLELSQSQMRDLVTQEQALSAESIVLVTSQSLGGTVMEIRGFQSEDQMIYRLLMQQPNGQIDEVLVNGTNGQHLSPSSRMGQIVSAVARNTSLVLVTAKGAIAAPEDGKVTN